MNVMNVMNVMNETMLMTAHQKGPSDWLYFTMSAVLYSITDLEINYYYYYYPSSLLPCPCWEGKLHKTH